jgi:hypothetical protein
MNNVLEQQVDALSRLASKIRNGLAQAELAVPPINEMLAGLAAMGVCDFEYEGPAVYCRPAGRSSDYDDSFIIYSAALTLPGGIGAALWSSCEYSERAEHFYSEPTDLRTRFVAFDGCPGPVKALVVLHAGKLLDRLLRDVRLSGSDGLAATQF